jgi:hypothetical protein
LVGKKAYKYTIFLDINQGKMVQKKVVKFPAEADDGGEKLLKIC